MPNPKIHDCPRIIRVETCEKPNKSGCEWWKEVFKTMEEKCEIPYHQRREVIRDILPEEIFERVDSVLSLIDTEEITERKVSVKGIQSFSTTFSSNLEEEKETEKSEEDDEESKLAGKKNPYLSFFKCDPLDAAIWYPPPPRDINTMPLMEKADALTEAIAADFVHWLKNLGGETETTLDVPQVMKMFEVGFSTHAASSLAVKIKELPCVARFIAESRKQPHKACNIRMKTKLMEDVVASRQKPRLRAFNAALPQTLVYIPPRKDLVDKWVACNVPEKLATMAVVWDGITHLRSTRVFCKWFAGEHRKQRPKYLDELGMFNDSFFLIPHYSIEEDSRSNLENMIVADIYTSRYKQ